MKRIICFLLIVLSFFVFASCTQEPEHEHSWDEGKVTTAATCTTEGIKTYTCTGCGETKTEVIAATGHGYETGWSHDDDYHWHAATCVHSVRGDQAQHTFGPDTVLTKPACTSTGTGSHTCTVCGKTVTYPIPKTHTPDDNHICTICGSFVPFVGPSGGYVFYDCDADNNEIGGGKGPDGLKSSSCGWRYLEAAPADLRIVDGVPTVDKQSSGYSEEKYYFVFGYYRTADDGNNLHVNGTTTWNWTDCTNYSIGGGKTNTRLLVEAMGEEAYSKSIGPDKTAFYAARLCDILTYNVNGVTFDDWYLPSDSELNLMYVNLYKSDLGDFANSYKYDYWSSSMCATAGWASAQDFSDGSQTGPPCVEYFRIRPIRAF